ncbi:hypothetical protein Sjap_013345 [Stephania japonica]|uniref:(+)-lariciresinol reductase n=1 Tax=Stephania japonica TaxID=461633 RepID=A0AAP0NYI8_9MAGN
MRKSRVLVVGGTGYLGKRLVNASLAQGHVTYVLHRPEIGVDIEKLQMLLSFKAQGARLAEGSFNDHRSLVNAVKLVDVVICAISGVHVRSHNILEQLKLVEAMKEAGNVKRFLPSEFGTDPARMGDAMEPGRVTFDDKMVVRKAIEEAGISFTYVSANCFAGYFLGGLCQPGKITPSKDSVLLLGEANHKVIYVDEDDIATYTIKTIDDPRTLNKTLYLRPPKNILSQREVVEIWEKLIGKVLEKSAMSKEDFLTMMKGQNYAEQVGLSHYYHVCYEGCLANFEIGEGGEEASKLYPELPRKSQSTDWIEAILRNLIHQGMCYCLPMAMGVEKIKVMEEEACSWTIEGLRGRLLAERVKSRTAKEQVEHLEKRLTELQGQLAIESESRDTAEMKLKWLTQKMKSLNGNGSSSSSTASSDLNLQEKRSLGFHFDDNVEVCPDMTSSLIMSTAHEEDPSS